MNQYFKPHNPIAAMSQQQRLGSTPGSGRLPTTGFNEFKEPLETSDHVNENDVYPAFRRSSPP
jgi:hypothetical protein